MTFPSFISQFRWKIPALMVKSPRCACFPGGVEPGEAPPLPGRGNGFNGYQWIMSWSYGAVGIFHMISYTLWLFNIAMEAMAHRNRWFTY